MQVPWFFATTPTPQRPHATHAPKRQTAGDANTWWARAVERFVAWGERSRKRSNASLMQV